MQECLAKRRKDEFGGPDSGAKVGRAGPGDEKPGILWRFGKAKRRLSKNALKEGSRVILSGDLATSREVAAESGDEATDEECGAHGS